MRVLWHSLLSVCLSVSLCNVLRADDRAEAWPLLEKAIKAMGGGAKLAKLKEGTGKGKITGQEGGKEISVTYEASWQGLAKYRFDAEAEFDGQTVKALMVINGDKGWMQANDRTEDAPKGVVPFIKNVVYTMRMPQLLPALKDKAFKLSPLGELKIGNRPVLGLSIAHKDHKDVSLFFDKENGLPVKAEIRIKEPQGKELTIEFTYSDYKDYDGIKHPRRVTIKGDGKEFTMEVSEIKPEDKLDDSLFNKPE